MSCFMKPYREDGAVRQNLKAGLTRRAVAPVGEAVRGGCCPQGGQEIGGFLTEWPTRAVNGYLVIPQVLFPR